MCYPITVPTPFANALATIGDTRFAERIRDLHESADDAVSAAGRNWQFDDDTCETLRTIKAEIAETESDAYDRHSDLSTDH